MKYTKETDTLELTACDVWAIILLCALAAAMSVAIFVNIIDARDDFVKRQEIGQCAKGGGTVITVMKNGVCSSIVQGCKEIK